MTNRSSMDDARAVFIVRLAHTMVWAVMASAIVALPVLSLLEIYDWALAMVALVVIEIVVLSINRWRCPLTAIAARYTDDRRPNFDIFLPEWLARWNKEIFGTLFVGGVLILWLRWSGWVG